MAKTNNPLLDLHFREVGAYTLPTAKQEYETFTAYHAARRKAQIATSPKEREEYEEEYKRLGKQIACWYLRFVIRQARRKTHDDVVFADLISAGYAGLMYAITLFEPARGNRFLTYANNWIKVRMQETTERLRTVRMAHGARKTLRRTRSENERKQALGESVETLEEPSIASIENVVLVDESVDIERDAQARSVNALALLEQAGLSRVERLVLVYAFGLRGGEPLDLKTIGQILYEIDGSLMTTARVEEIQKRALARLRDRLAEEEIYSLTDVLTPV